MKIVVITISYSTVDYSCINLFALSLKNVHFTEYLFNNVCLYLKLMTKMFLSMKYKLCVTKVNHDLGNISFSVNPNFFVGLPGRCQLYFLKIEKARKCYNEKGL